MSKRGVRNRPHGSWEAPHRAYLAARAITVEWAERAGLSPVSADVAGRIAGRKAYSRSAIGLTFPDLDGRVIEFRKLNFAGQEAVGFAPTKEEKRAPKTWQQPGRSPPMYLAPPPPGERLNWREFANDTTRPLVLTEGEFKALAAALHGYWCAAFPGVENFHEAGDPERLVEVFRDVPFHGRRVYVVFDSNAATNPNVLKAEAKLKAVLERRGAEVLIVRLPPPADGRKGGQGLDDFIATEGVDAFRKLAAAISTLPDRLDTGHELLDTDYPPLTFAIPTYLPKREVVEIHGAHGQFKSTIMLYACLAVATGEPWGTCAVEQGSAVFISLEDRASTLKRRVLGWMMNPPKFSGEPRRDSAKLERAVRERFAYLGRERAAPLVLTETSYGQTLPRRAAVDRIVALCAGRDLIVLETAARLHPGGETNEALSVFASVLEEIAERTGACVVLVRHVSKEAARNSITDSYAGRGGGALADAARSVLSVERRGEHPFDPVFLVHTKSTHTGRGPDLAWRPEAVGDLFRLRTATPDDIAKAAACKWFDLIAAAGPEGIRQSDLEKRADSGKGDRRKRIAEFRAAIDELVKQGRVVRRAVGTAPGRKPIVLWAAGLEPKEDDA